MGSGSLEIANEAGFLANGTNGLQLPLPSSPTSILSPTSSQLLSSLSTASSSSSEDLLAAAGPVDLPDSFLQEALNSRNRITVLRLERDIEKFALNSKHQQLLLRPMLSSYERLAAHRVAQYYNLHSMAVESNGSSGPRILLLKTPDSKVPSIRLVDIPVNVIPNEKPASPPLGKVAIKQRTGQLINRNHVASTGRMTLLKSVEERTEEYNRARARIFSSGDLVNGKDVRVAGISREDQDTMGERPLFTELISAGLERDRHDNGAEVRAANRVAVFRDREKDRDDPDYDRSYGRYSPPLKAGVIANGKPVIALGVCSSSGGMLCHGGIGNSQMRVNSAFCPAFEGQNGPWVGLAGLPVLGYPCTLPSTCTQGQSLSNAYPSTQKLVHPEYQTFASWHQFPTKINSHPMSSAHVMDWSRSY